MPLGVSYPLAYIGDLEVKVKVTAKVKLAKSATAGPIKFIFGVLVPLAVI